MGHVTIATPLSGTVCRQWAGTSCNQAVYQIRNLYVQVHPPRRYKRRRKMQKLGWFLS